jgi:chromosome segregation ATPase
MTEHERNRDIDLDEVARLVAALERDLANLRSGTADVATLRREVEQLRATLESTGEDRAQVHSGLHSIRDLLHAAADELRADAVKGSQYVAQIGRILGL